MAKRRQIFVDEAAGEELILPVTPSSYQWDSGVSINTVTLDGLGDLHIPGRKALATENIECFFPARNYPFNEPDTTLDPFHYVEWLEKRSQARTVLRYIVSGTPLNVPVLIEAIRYWEDDGSNDLGGRITIREYAAPQTLTVTAAAAETTRSRSTETAAEAYSHTVVSGDSLWALCLKYYGTASIELCQRVAAYNGIQNINLIYPGDIIRFPVYDDLPATGIALSNTQEAATKTQISEDESGKLVMTTDSRSVNVTLAMSGISQHYGTATMTYTPDGKGRERTITTTAAEPRLTVKIRAGSRIQVKWSETKGESDYRMVSGAAEVKSTTPMLRYWPEVDMTITVHWVKGG